MSDEHKIDPVEYGMLVQQVAHLTTKVDSMEKNVQAMRDLMEQGKGGWRVLAWIGGLIGVLAAAGGWLAAHVTWR